MAGAFNGFHDRIKILSHGKLPPGQTREGFYAGESIPVNEALSKIFVQLHITEHTGRGVPKITEVYGRENIYFSDRSIRVTIPFDRLGEEVYAQVEDKNAPVNVPVEDKNVPVNAPVDLNKKSSGAMVLEYCINPKGILEIAEYLGYKDKRSVRKIINPLLEQGRLAMTIPEKPNSRFQKYITIR